MSRFDITLGMLSILGAVVLISILAMGETSRMPQDSRGFEVRMVENGAAMFDQYCANCHGVNASGGICPALDETSGLHGGEFGEGIAWRLEDLGWDRQGAYEYVYSAIESGRTVSTRPEEYQGNRTADVPNSMAMPAWGQDYGGPLRPDQIGDLTQYIVAFADAIATDSTPRPTQPPTPTARPTRAAATETPDGAQQGTEASGGTPGTAEAGSPSATEVPGGTPGGAPGTAGAGAAGTAAAVPTAVTPAAGVAVPTATP